MPATEHAEDRSEFARRAGADGGAAPGDQDGLAPQPPPRVWDADAVAGCQAPADRGQLQRLDWRGWAPLVDAFEAAGRDPDRAVATTDGWVSEFEIGIRSTMDREESTKTPDRMQAVRAREAKEGVPRIGGRRPSGFTRDMSEHVADEVERICRGGRPGARRRVGVEHPHRLELVHGLDAYVRDLICAMLADPVTRAAMSELAPVASPGSVSTR